MTRQRVCELNGACCFIASTIFSEWIWEHFASIMGGSTEIFLHTHARLAMPLPMERISSSHSHMSPSFHMQTSSLIAFTSAILLTLANCPLLMLPTLVDMVSHLAQPHLHSHQWILCSSSIFDALLLFIFECHDISLSAYASPYFGLMSFTLSHPVLVFASPFFCHL
jgi:hypothetical protein